MKRSSGNTRPPSRNERRRVKVVVASASILLGLTWAIPGHATDENRVLAGFPAISLHGVASGVVFRELDAALADHNPLKAPVVGAVSGALLSVGLSPSTSVFRAPGGEPFFAGDFNGACTNDLPKNRADQQIHDLQASLAQQKISFLYAVIPDKTTSERATLGPLGPSLLTCSSRNREYLTSAAREPGSPLLVAWPQFDSAVSAGERLYIYGDSHWSPAGGELYSKLLLARLVDDGAAGPNLLADLTTIPKKVQHRDDLFLLMGQTRMEPVEMLSTVRPNVRTTYSSAIVRNQLVQHWHSSSPNEPLIPGRTLVLHDSSFEYNAEILAPFFADLTAVPLAVSDDPGALAKTGKYDRVILQQMQRSVPLYVDSLRSAKWIAGG